MGLSSSRRRTLARRLRSAPIDRYEQTLPLERISVPARSVQGGAMLVTLHQSHAGAIGFAQRERHDDEQREHDGDLRIGRIGKKRHQLPPSLPVNQPST